MGGGHGALDFAVPKIVDRVFTGAAEDDIARVFGKRVPDDDVEHPALPTLLRFIPSRFRYLTLGLLHTERGCPFRCTFCQTPVFDTKRFKIKLEYIERAVKYYRRLGVNDIFVLDEMFGSFPAYADKLTELFARYKIRWWAQSRAALFLRHLDTWYERGLRFPLIGVETMNQGAMDNVDKRQRLEKVYEYSRKTKEKPGVYRMVYYMIGYDSMTLEDTLTDVACLKQAGFDAHQVNVLTPFPKTILWDELESKYGIFDRDYSHFDAKYLVWNHPHISPRQMHYLLKTTIGFLNKPIDMYGKGFSRIFWDRLRTRGLDFIWHDLVKGPIASALIDGRNPKIF